MDERNILLKYLPSTFYLNLLSFKYFFFKSIKQTTRSNKQQNQTNNKIKQSKRSNKQQDQINNKIKQTTRSYKQQDQTNSKIKQTTRSN